MRWLASPETQARVPPQRYRPGPGLMEEAATCSQLGRPSQVLPISPIFVNSFHNRRKDATVPASALDRIRTACRETPSFLPTCFARYARLSRRQMRLCPKQKEVRGSLNDELLVALVSDRSSIFNRPWPRINPKFAPDVGPHQRYVRRPQAWDAWRELTRRPAWVRLNPPGLTLRAKEL